jgi:hypothetical protein
MRTKTLLLTAALSAASLVTSMAQVYSVNMVGYINLTVPGGLSLIANQLNASPNNDIAVIMPTPTLGTTVFKFNPGTGGYFSSQNTGPGVWEGDPIVVNPGEAIFIDNPGAQFTTTLVGEVQLNSSVAISPGIGFLSSVIPQALPLDNPAMNFPVQPGDTVFIYNSASGSYDVYPYSDSWENGAPTPKVGEGFSIDSVGSKNWVRNFPVGP